jgi:endoglucanase
MQLSKQFFIACATSILFVGCGGGGGGGGGTTTPVSSIASSSLAASVSSISSSSSSSSISSSSSSSTASGFAFCALLTSDPDDDGIGLENDKSCQMRTGFDITHEMGIGWNMGNTMDATGNKANPLDDETYWGNPKATQANTDTLKAAGFNTMRLPVSWDDHTGAAPNYVIDSAWLDRVEEIANYALNSNMYVIVNIHHNNGWPNPTLANEANATARLQKLWAQIATRFEKYDHRVIFETLNEPRDQKVESDSGDDDWWGNDSNDFAVLNRLNAKALETIRSTGGNNAKRLVMMPGYAAGVAEHQLNAIVIPNDKMVALSVHSYTSYNFALNLGAGSVTIFGASDQTEINAIFNRIDSKFLKKGIPVIMGEWGSTDKGNLAERVKQAKYYAQKASALKVPLVVWDNGNMATFDPNKNQGEIMGLLDRRTNTWRFPEIIDAIKTNYIR